MLVSQRKGEVGRGIGLQVSRGFDKPGGKTLIVFTYLYLHQSASLASIVLVYVSFPWLNKWCVCPWSVQRAGLQQPVHIIKEIPARHEASLFLPLAAFHSIID